MTKRLFLDLERCDQCEQCQVQCAYFYRPAATDHGVFGLRERAQFALVCRRCEEPSCVSACRFQALERQSDGVMRRYNLRCVSCKSCSTACPFGTIYPETVPFYATGCDFCAGKEGTPPCVVSCTKGALAYQEVEASEQEGIHLVSERLAVRAPQWKKKDG